MELIITITALLTFFVGFLLGRRSKKKTKVKNNTQTTQQPIEEPTQATLPIKRKGFRSASQDKEKESKTKVYNLN